MAYGPEAKYFSNLNYSAYQSRNGYLWFGTLNGLVRFDGKRYKNYFSNYADPKSPADNTIFDITEDKNGDLWFAGFYHGATRYNQHTGVFKKYPVLSKDNFPYYGIYRIFSDSQGNLWFATAGRGLARYIFEKDNFEFFYPEPDKPKDGSVRGYNYVTDITEDKKNKNILWITGFHGLFLFDKLTKAFTHFTSDVTASQPDILFNDVEQDNKGRLWLGTWGSGLHCFETATKKFIKGTFNSYPGVFYDLKMINDSLLYAACLNQGLFQLNTETGSFTNITPPRNPADPTAQQPNIQKVSVTPDAGVFIGGNYYFYQQHPDFRRLKKNIFFPKGKPNANTELNDCVWDEKRQQYWIATNNGIYRLQKDLKEITGSTIVTRRESSTYYFDIVIDGLQRVWVLNFSEGVLQWNDEERSFRPASNIIIPDSLIKKVKDIIADKSGNLWFVTGEDFIYWDVSQNKTETFHFAWDKDYKGTRMLNSSELKVDPEGNAWWLSQNGIFHCNRTSKKVTHIFKTGKTEYDLASQVVRAGSFDAYKGLWITSGNGIQVMDRNDFSILANHDIAGGLPSMAINAIAADKAGRIWAGTAAGLAFFDPPTKTWKLFNRFDGLERDYLDGQIIVTSNNKIVVDQVNGFLIRDINELLPQGNPPALRITSIFINKQEYNDTLLPEFVDKLVLSHKQNNIEIEYAAMDWVYPFKTTYQYTIEGIPSASTWMPDPECKINLTGLQPGDYVVRVKALSGNGVFSNEIVLPITIRPPFWKTGWFIIIMSVALIALVTSLYRYRIRQLKSLMTMRNNISRNLHDDIGASLSNINILNELAKRNIEKDDKKAKEYLYRSGEDIQRISESLSDIVWNINPRYDDIDNLFIRMKRYAADMMEGKNITAAFDFPGTADKFTMPMDQRRDFYLIFKEALNNLVKYSQATKAGIRVEISGHKIRLEIEDNGRGFDTTTANTGNGLQNIRARADKWNAALDISSIAGKGTKIVLEMNA